MGRSQLPHPFPGNRISPEDAAQASAPAHRAGTQRSVIAFDNRFIQLPAAFWRRQLPSPLRNPRLLAVNTSLLHELGIDSAWMNSADALAGLSGHAVWPGADPVAMKYAGHQFGGWNPDLGDGRGLLLGEIIDRHGCRQDLHLKGKS